MPPRVNKRLLLIIVGVVLVLVVGGTLWVVLRRPSAARRQQVIQDTASYLASGQHDRARFEMEAWISRAPKDGEVRMKLARLLEADGHLGEAYAEYRNVIRYDPLNMEALLRIAYYEGQFQRWGEMRRIAQVVVGISPTNALARLYTAQADLGLGPDSLLDGLDNAREALRLDPKNIDTYLTIARIQQQRKVPAEVKKVLDEAFVVNPKSQDLYSFLSIYHLRMGQKAEAEAALLAALENATDIPRAHMELGSYYTEVQNWAKAEAEFKTACDLATTQGAKLASHSALGDFYLRREQYDEALKQYDEALVALPTAPMVLLKKAHVYLAEKRYDECLKAVNDVKGRGRPDAYQVEALFVNGHRLLLTGKMDESIAELNQAVTLVRAGELKINTSEIRLILAQAYLRRGDTGSARDALVAAHAEAPDSPRITMALAELLFALHDYDEVISTLNTPQKPYEGYVLQAKAYMGRHAKGDDREALSQLGKAHALRPDAPEVYVALGQCAIMTRNFDEAVKEFDEAIKLNPNDTVARLSKAIAYEVAKNPAKVDQTYREALAALPKVMTLRYEYARYLARSNRFDEGEKVLLDEISRLSDDPTGRKEYEAQMPRYYLSAGKMDKATEWYRKAAQSDPKNMEVRQALVQLALSQGQAEEAARVLEEIKKVEKADSPRVLRLEGQVLVAQQKYAEGLKKLLSAEKSSPQDPDVQYLVGLCYMQTGAPGEARTYLEKVYQRFPTSDRVMRALAEVYYNLGLVDQAKDIAEKLKATGANSPGLDIILNDALTKKGSPAEAETGWRAFIVKHPERQEGHMGLADALWRQEKRDEALRTMQKGYDLNPKSFRAGWTLANMYLMEKQYDKAIAVVQGTLSPKNDNLSLLGLLARLYEVSGRQEDAGKTYARIAELDPKSPLPAVARGDRAFGKKDLPTAEAAYREALKLQGDNPVVRDRLIDVLVNEKKFTDAASVIDAALAVAKTPDDIGLLVLKARVRVVDKKYDEGIRLYKQAIKASRDARVEAKNYLIHYELGQLYMSLERPNDARQSLDAACELNPDFIDGRLALMDIAVRQNNLNEARAAALAIVEKKPNLPAYDTLGDIALSEGDLPTARKYYDRAVKEFPGETLPLRKQVSVLMAENKTDAAVTQLKQILQLEKQNPEMLATLSSVLVGAKRPDEALAACRESLDKTTDPATVYRIMGDIEQSRKQYAKAREYYDMALDKRANEPGVVLAKAQSYLLEGNLEKAVATARQALKMNPTYDLGYGFIDQVYRLEKKDKEMEQLYQEWMSAMPESVVAVNNYAWYLSDRKGDMDAALKAVQAYRRRMAAAGKAFTYAAALDDTEGDVYFKKGDYAHAVDLFRKSVEARRDSVSTWERLRATCLALAERAKEQKDVQAAQRYEIEARDAFTKIGELSQNDPGMQVRLGDQKFSEGRLDEAIQAYERALELKTDRDVERKLAEVMIRAGRTEEAQRYVGDLAKAEPKEPKNFILQGMLYSRAGDRAKAVETFEDVARKYPDVMMGHYILAQEYIAQNRAKDGQAELDKAIALSPTFTEARLMKGRLLAAEGDLDGAVGECKAVLQRTPSHFEAMLSMGNYLLAQGKMSEAENTFKAMTQKWPESADAHERLGETYRRSNRLGEALVEYQDCRRRAPHSIVVMRGLTWVFLGQGKPDLAVREYGTYLEDNPDSTDAWLDLAGVYGAKKQWADVERCVKTAVKTAHANPEVHRKLVDFYIDRRRFSEAMDAARKLAVDIPTKQGRASSFLCIARTYEAEGKLDEAVKEYRQVLTEDPEMVIAANNLAWLLATKNKQVDEALKVIEPYLKKYQGFAELMDTAGWIYRLNNEPKKAEPLLAQAVQLQIGRGEVLSTILYHYGEVLFINGKTEDAKRVLQLATKVRFPEYEPAMDILGKIR